MSCTTNRILIIDDDKAIHRNFKEILEPKHCQNVALDNTKTILFGQENTEQKNIFHVDSAFQGQQGLEKVIQAEKQNDPYIMAFIDIRMAPGWDGVKTIKKIWEYSSDLQIIICTAYSDYSWPEIIDQIGQTDRLLILKKPFDSIEVRQIACALTEKWHLLHNLEKLVEHRTKQIAQTRDITVFALANLAESRDPESAKHLQKIRLYSKIIAEELKNGPKYSDVIDEKFLEDLYRSSPLHDIGKVGIPDYILLKPGKLTPQEYKIMENHSIIGADALEKTVKITKAGGFLKMAADIARYHHEKYDGSGYPYGIAGEQIPLAARIVALADVYDALTSARVYKPAFTPELASLMILQQTGKHFDPDIVRAFSKREKDFTEIAKNKNSHKKSQKTQEMQLAN